VKKVMPCVVNLQLVVSFSQKKPLTNEQELTISAGKFNLFSPALNTLVDQRKIWSNALQLSVMVIKRLSLEGMLTCCWTLGKSV